MIAKKVANPKKSATKAERAGGLANYITAPERENGLEKCIHFEAINFMTKTFAGQKAEMIALSQEAVKSKDPIDHWVLSWRQDERPTPAQAREVVEMFVDHCGLKGHQYIWGLHDDTKNMHVHIQVNRVHPDTLKVTKINKGFDREASQQAIALIEYVQGWTQEKGARYDIENGKPVKREQVAAKQLEPSNKAKAMELQTGEKSAQRTGIEAAAPIIASAKSWKELHEQMAAAGMHYERKGSGAIVHVGAVPVKASDVSRAASLSAMQKRFGPYQPSHEIKKNEYHDTSRNFTAANAKEPYPVAAGKNTGHGLRYLSKCTLAHSEKTRQGERKRSGILQLDARPDRRVASGLRWDTGRDRNAALTPQPIKPKQPGWNEYTLIRDEQKAAKVLDTTELQKRHGAERAALAVKLKAERIEIFSGSWKGKGDARNALQSVLATQQATLKLELSERQKEERKALQARYKSLPMYRQWKEQPLIVSQVVRSPLDQRIERDRQPSALVQMLKSLSHTIDKRGHVTYQSAGRDVFRDEGRIIQVLDLKSDSGIAAALATAQQKFGPVLTLTGSPEFQQNAVAVAIQHGLTCRFADPVLEAMRGKMVEEQREAARAAQAKVMPERVWTPVQVPAQSLIPSAQQVERAAAPAAKAVPTPAPAPAAPNHLTLADRAALDAVQQATAGGDAADMLAAYKVLRDIASEVQSQVKYETRYPPPEPVESDIRVAAKRQIQRNMNDLAKQAGQPEPWRDETRFQSLADTYQGKQASALESLARHERQPRPEGFFRKAEGHAWDSERAGLEKAAATWSVAIERRDAELTERERVAEPMIAASLIERRQERATKVAEHQRRAARAEQLGEALQFVNAQLAKRLGPDYEKEITKDRGYDHGM